MEMKVAPVGNWNEVEDVGVNANKGLPIVLAKSEWEL